MTAPNISSTSYDTALQRSQKIWEKIERNLEFIASYGGIVELNSSSLRKGMSEPYPQVEICKVCTLISCHQRRIALFNQTTNRHYSTSSP